VNVSHSIQGRITLIVLLFGLAMIVLNNWRNQKWLVERRLNRLEQEAADTGSHLSGLLQHLSRKQQERAAELEMAYVSLSADVELGVVCDWAGVVSCATQLQWRGMRVLETPLASEWQHVMPTLERMDTFISWDDEKAHLIVIAPFYEGYDTTSKAAVLIRYNSTQALTQVREEALHESLRQAGVLLALSLLMWFALDELVTRRVRKLVSNLRAVGTSTAPPEVLPGNDELTTISREFSRTVTQLRAAENLVLDAAEQERRKFGRDLHDDVCQRLSAIKMTLEVMRGLMPDKDGKVAGLAQQVIDDLAKTVVIARSMARGLSPVGLENHGLKDALENVALFAERMYQVRCAVECVDVHGHLPVVSQELLFRIAQELVTNACKHSSPGVLNLSVHLADDQIVLSVIHDGKPFDDADVSNGSSGMGLHLMNQRLRTLSATLERTIKSEGRDFSIATVRIPLMYPVSNEREISTNNHQGGSGG
jgi:signal transduction histidine kinase